MSAEVKKTAFLRGRVEQGASRRPEASPSAEGGLGHSGAASDGGSQTRSCLVQSRHRQQTARLRSRQPSCRRHRSRRPRERSGDDHSAQDRPAGSVRDHGADSRLVAGVVERATGEIEAPTSSRAAFTTSLIFPRDNTRASCMAGSRVRGWTASAYGTHSLRRTKAAQIYRKTGNLRAVQLLLGHTKIESTVRYLGIEVDDALTLSEQVEL